MCTTGICLWLRPDFLQKLISEREERREKNLTEEWSLIALTYKDLKKTKQTNKNAVNEFPKKNEETIFKVCLRY